MVGGDPSDVVTIGGGSHDIDGRNMWPALIGANHTNPRPWLRKSDASSRPFVHVVANHRQTCAATTQWSFIRDHRDPNDRTIAKGKMLKICARAPRPWPPFAWARMFCAQTPAPSAPTPTWQTALSSRTLGVRLSAARRPAPRARPLALSAGRTAPGTSCRARPAPHRAPAARRAAPGSCAPPPVRASSTSRSALPRDFAPSPHGC